MIAATNGLSVGISAMVSETSKFRVTIPVEVRKDLGIRIGDDIVFLRAVSGACQIMKASELVRQFCEESLISDRRWRTSGRG